MKERDSIPSSEEAEKAIASGERFWSLNYSVSAHCCFDATVIDLTKPIIGGFESICETFELGDARRIAEAMNAKYPES